MESPVENNIDIAKIKFINGIDMLTAARANSLAPLLTNIPSTIVYSEKTHMATTYGAKYLINFLLKLRSSFIDILVSIIITLLVIIINYGIILRTNKFEKFLIKFILSLEEV